MSSISGVKPIQKLNMESSEISSFSSDGIYETIDFDEIEKINKENDFASIAKTAGATAANGVISLVEGIGELGEAILDTGAILSTAMSTPITGLADSAKAYYTVGKGTVNAIKNKENLFKSIGKEFEHFESITSKNWENTKSFVSKQHVKSAFDSFYDNAGSWIKDNSLASETIRSVGSSIGYVGGIVAISVLTFGAGGAAVGASGTAGAAAGAGAGTASSSAASLSSIMGIVGGSVGVGKGSEKAWSEGASVGKGLAYGVANGAWEGLQFYLGGEINSINVGKSALVNSGARVALDAIDSGAEGLVQPGLEMIYKDKSYSQLFDEAGGWNNVAIQASVGAAMSAFGEASGLAKKYRETPKSIESTMGLLDKLSFFDDEKRNSASKLFGNPKEITPNMSPKEITKKASFINSQINKNGEAIIQIKNSAELNSDILSSVSDLSKLQVQFKGGYFDENGVIKPKYNEQKYFDRFTYNGFETFDILKKIEQLDSLVDKNLPTGEKARQIYNIVSSEIPPMRDYKYLPDGYLNSQSLRGITANNTSGREGLICAGYATLYKELCERNNIRCEYIRGTGIADILANKSGLHAWNMVVDGDQLIPVDVTWKASGGDEWFGGSQKFVEKHIADEDEIFKDFSMPYVKKIDATDNSSILDSIVDVIDAKEGYGTGIVKLQRLVNEGNYNLITRTNNSRELISKIPMEEINSYVSAKTMSNSSSILSAFNSTSQKYGTSQAYEALKKYAVTGDAGSVTSSNNARDIIKNTSPSEVMRFVQVIDNLDSVKQGMINKYGEAGITNFNYYLSTGDVSYITNDNNLRDVARSIKDIERFNYASITLGG